MPAPGTIAHGMARASSTSAPKIAAAGGRPGGQRKLSSPRGAARTSAYPRTITFKKSAAKRAAKTAARKIQ
jgi:hypothetical protein